MKINPDDRRDNAKKIQDMIDHTMKNIHNAEAAMSFSNESDKVHIQEKNAQRRETLQSLQQELKEEIPFSEGNI